MPTACTQGVLVLIAAGSLAVVSCGDDAGDENEIDARTGQVDAADPEGDAGSSGSDATTDLDAPMDLDATMGSDASPDASPIPLTTWAVAGVAGRAHAVAVDASGVYVAGRGGPENWRVEKRSHADGAILWEQEATEPSPDADGIAVDATGVYVVGNGRLEKRGLEDGAVLWSVSAPPVAMAVAVDATGVYVVGAEPVPGDISGAQQWRVDKRSASDGSELWSKTVDYAVAVDIADTGREHATAVAVDGNGLYIGGVVEENWQIERRDLTTGALVWQKAETSGPVGANGIAVAGGGVFVGGSERQEPPGGRFRWRAERRAATDGATAWARSFDPSPGSVGYDDHCMSVAADASSLYLVGLSTQNAFEPSDRRWEIQAWDSATGAERWKVAFDFSTDNDVPFDVAVDGHAVYVVGDGGGLWRIEKRDKQDGQL